MSIDGSFNYETWCIFPDEIVMLPSCIMQYFLNLRLIYSMTLTHDAFGNYT